MDPVSRYGFADCLLLCMQFPACGDVEYPRHPKGKNNGYAFIRQGIQKVWFYYDSRFALPVQIMFWGNILFPAMTLLWSVLCLIKKKKASDSTLLSGLLVCSVLNACTAASVPALTKEYYLALGSGTIHQYLVFVLMDLLFFICPLPCRQLPFGLEREIVQTQIPPGSSFLFWTDFIEAEYNQQDHDSYLYNLSACCFSVHCGPHFGELGFRLSGYTLYV